MRSWHTLFFYLFTSAIYLQSMNAAAAAAAHSHLLVQRSLRVLRLLHVSQQHADQKIKVVPKETMIDAIQTDSFPKESANVDEQELVYHIDYHGVTTHPNPTPKHPKP